MTDEILYEVRDRVAWITLNRPERMNAMTREMMTVTVPETWARFDADDEARVAVLTGAGERAFCAGMDVRQVAEREAEGKNYRDGDQAPVRVSPRVNGVRKPVIAAVNGVCTGVAIQIVADCDLVIASETAYFSDARVSMGLIAALGAAEITRNMPVHEALRLMLMGRHGRLTAERAYQIGFVGELAAADKLLDAAADVAEAIMLNAPLAVRITKQAIWEGLDRGLSESIAHSRSLSEANPTREDVLEGAKSFVEKRQADWKLR